MVDQPRRRRWFNFDGTTYKVTNIGLINSELVKEIGNAITKTELNGTDCQTIKQAIVGVFVIDSSTGTDLMVIDTETDPLKAAQYLTLNKSGNVYTFRANGTNSLTTITINGVIATFPPINATITATNAAITAGEATFVPTATDTFTVDATGIPAIGNATDIN